MPRGPIPEQFHHILESTSLGHLATIGGTGEPQVNPVWFLWDEGQLLLGVKADTVKYRNLRRDPRLALSISDPKNPGSYIELRGEVIEFVRHDDLTFVNRLARKYTGRDMNQAEDGMERYKLVVRIDRWTGQ